jgi:hypothetical protein
MRDEESKRHAQATLEAMGYSVTLIETSNVKGEQRADLRASIDGETLVVEAKSKAEHTEFISLRNEARVKGTASCSREERAWSALSSVVKKANSQLASTSSPNGAGRVFWVPCLHEDWAFVFEGFRQLLYGQVELTLFQKCIGPPKFVGIRNCFYYDQADFRKYTAIDAAVLAGPNGELLLFVNEFGTRVKHLRNTKLYREMNESGGVIDPRIQCEKLEAFAIADPSLHSEKEKWNYLFDTYGFQTSKLSGFSFKSMITIPKSGRR